jgi:hypothetical protein
VGAVDHNPRGPAQDLDPGNFKTDDEAVATIDWVKFAVAATPLQPPATILDGASAGIADLVAHEAGHLFGCFHTDQSLTDPFAGTSNLMDPNTIAILGPDLIFGSADDVNLQFGVDSYSSNEIWRGLDDTLNTVAFGLSTGKVVTRGGGQRAAASAFATKAISTAEDLLATPDELLT